MSESRATRHSDSSQIDVHSIHIFNELGERPLFLTPLHGNKDATILLPEVRSFTSIDFKWR